MLFELLILVPNELQGAFWGLCAGTLAGFVRLVIDFVFPDPVCGDETYVGVEPSKALHYLHFAIILAAFTAIVTIAVSFCLPAWPDAVVRARLQYEKKRFYLDTDPCYIVFPSCRFFAD